MENIHPEPPRVRVIDSDFRADEVTRVERVTLTSECLSITMVSRDSEALVCFEQTYGFRVLDEYDLTEFWAVVTLKDGWLFEVERGGWKDLELKRSHFLSGRNDWVTEYLVIGLNDCVSVLTKQPPTIRRRSAHDV